MYNTKTEREGFEPSIVTYAGFQNRCIEPLCHLSSILYYYSLINSFIRQY